MVLNQFLPSKECFHEIFMLFISWHRNYLKNCKWYFQTMFDFICCSSFYFTFISEVFDRSKTDWKNKLILLFFLNKKYIFYGKLCKWISNINIWVISDCFFLFSHINCSQMKARKWKNTAKLCLKFCRSVESSASERRNSA